MRSTSAQVAQEFPQVRTHGKCLSGSVTPICALSSRLCPGEPAKALAEEITMRAAAMHADGNQKAFPLFLLATLGSLAGLAGCGRFQEKLAPASASSYPIPH